MLKESTEPPYKTFIVSLVLKIFLNNFFIKMVVFDKSEKLGVFPVPIDHMGSYAIVSSLKSSGKQSVICFSIKSIALLLKLKIFLGSSENSFFH